MKTAVPPPAKPATLRFKIADREEEFEAIHRLNHRTFAEEIPQHEVNPERRLVDRFHARNRYVIALKGGTLAGMVCLRLDRPFSLDQKIPEAMTALPPDRSWCEIRLLALDPRHRGTLLLAGLLRALIREAGDRGCDAGVISATTRQLKLYRHLGFTPFGPLVGREGAWYQPMWVLLEALQRAVPVLADSGKPTAAARPPESRFRSAHPAPPDKPGAGTGDQAATPVAAVPAGAAAVVNFTPGPVEIPEYVREAFRRPAVPHRGPEALLMLAETRRALCRLTGAAHAALMSGGGTLANDVVAARLELLPGRGLIVDSGEFGRRLTDHARRAGLNFDTLVTPRGGGLTVAEIETFLQERGRPAWLWLTHCETSTGALHPLEEIADFCGRSGILLCADCVSSLGVVPVDLSRVHLATASGGKGLASTPGIAIVFHRDPAEPVTRGIPRCLDLGMHAGEDGGGMPFTLGSPLLAALHAALTLTVWHAKIRRVRRMGHALRRELEAAGMPLLPVGTGGSPAVMTLCLPPHIPCVEFAEIMERRGIRLAAHSAYLLEKNEVQICLMGDLRPEQLMGLKERLTAAWLLFQSRGL